jgi:hypothetical protein
MLFVLLAQYELMLDWNIFLGSPVIWAETAAADRCREPIVEQSLQNAVIAVGLIAGLPLMLIHYVFVSVFFVSVHRLSSLLKICLSYFWLRNCLSSLEKFVSVCRKNTIKLSQFTVSVHFIKKISVHRHPL